MFSIKLVDQIFTVDNQYPYVEQMCQDYLVTPDQPGTLISISDAELQAERTDDGNWSDAYLESLAVYRKIVELLLSRDVLLFHCSALELDGKAYLFTAPSGTGKSTHAGLWRQRFGDRVVMINDDKPLLALHNGTVTVFGTPYAGKEGRQTNTSAPVGGIVILHQAPENSIRPLSPREAYPELLNQTYRPKEPARLIHTMDLVQELAQLPLFELGCTISQEAVTLSYEALTGASR